MSSISYHRWPILCCKGREQCDNLLDFGQVFKDLAMINLPNPHTFLGNFYKGVKVYYFSSEIILGQLLWTFGDFFWSHW